MNAVILILSDARGIYIPRDFVTDDCNQLNVEHCKAWGMNDSNKTDWENCIDPEYEWYWESWDWILDNASFTDDNGNVYRLEQNGDLWGICYELMTDEEKRNFGFEE